MRNQPEGTRDESPPLLAQAIGGNGSPSTLWPDDP